MSHRLRLNEAGWVRLGAALVVVAFGAAAWAADAPDRRVTFTEDVAPIFFSRCLECHRPGEIAPMSLLSYEDARPWAKSIKKKVANREMPPWDADPRFGHFSNNRSLTEEEIATIASWVDQDSPRGDPAKMPPVPKFTEGWQLGEPDYIVELPEIDIPPGENDIFPNISVRLDLPEDRWIRAIEVRPSAREVNHHVVLFMNGVGMGAGGEFNALAVWAVGTPPTVYPEGMGRWVSKNQGLIANMHYHPDIEQHYTDRTRVGLYFGEGELKKEITSALAGNMTFQIPPNVADHKVMAEYVIDQDVSVISYFPHMHLRGAAMKFTAHYPDGKSETLISVPEYDFNWQMFYYPVEPVPLPKGTTIEIEAHYNNSTSNLYNPDPDRAVTFGLESTDEMMFGLFDFIPDDGVSIAPVTGESKLASLVERHPADEVYNVDLAMGAQPIKTALYLPKQGEGKWYILFGSQVITLPVTDVAWRGDGFNFKVRLSFGRMGGTFLADGAVDTDGKIQGEFEQEDSESGQGGMMLLRSFKGARAG